MRYLVAHLLVLPSAGLFVFSSLFAMQALLRLVFTARLLRALSVALQLVCVIGVVQMLMFSLFLSGWFADNGLRLSGDAVAAWVPPFWFLGLYETVLGTEHAIFRTLAPRAGLATLASLAVATLAYLARYRHLRQQVLESPVPQPREPGAVARAVRWVTDRVVVRGATEQAVVGFVMKTLRRSPHHPLLFAVYVGVALGFVAMAVLVSWPGAEAESGVARFMRVAMGVRGDARGLEAPTTALLCIPHVLAFFTLVGLRVLFTIPSELSANWVFRVTETNDTTGYLRAARLALRLSLVPIVAVTLPGYWLLWGAPLAIGHTVLWVWLAMVLAELLLFRFHTVPFACAYVPGRDRILLLGGVGLMAMSFYVIGASRTEVLLLADPVRWATAGAMLTICLAVAASVNGCAGQTARSLTFVPLPDAVPEGLVLSGARARSLR